MSGERTSPMFRVNPKSHSDHHGVEVRTSRVASNSKPASRTSAWNSSAERCTPGG